MLRGLLNLLKCSVALLALALSGGCSRDPKPVTKPAPAVVDAGAPAEWAVSSGTPSVPKGMVWIPAGALVAGTPPEVLPRKADREMPGEQIVLAGFFIDQYAFPNEQGGIPLTNVTQEAARALCVEKGKRLCSELEWERACKGPRNLTYEYGNRYIAQTCATGGNARPLPSGYLHGCRSESGVSDLHGGVWEWTDSVWGRGAGGDRVTVRGGNGPEGEVIGRCANAEPKAPYAKAPDVGFRCCSGSRNPQEVTLTIQEGQPLLQITRIDRELAKVLEGGLPETEAREMKKRGVFRLARLWEWKPVANEDLLVGGGCAGSPPNRRCGVILVRRTLGRFDVLGWAPSGHFPPTVQLKFNPRVLYVYGGDRLSHYRRAVSFEWGSVAIGSEQRNKDTPF
jgi:formylglycine-generating enzyme